MNYRIANPYMSPFTQSILTDLMYERKIKKADSNHNFATYCITKSFLEDYGVFIKGNTNLRDLNGNSRDTKAYFIMIDLDFPTENVFLFDELYNWEDCLINIGIGSEEDLDGCYSFDYNTNDKSFTLLFMRHGATVSSKRFDLFEDMINNLKN